MRKPKPFATEVELCAEFLSVLPAEWTAYAETAGWDILLVRKADGFQIGVEAKLKLNALVVTQVLEEYGSWAADRAGPDCRAVLVPSAEGGFERIAKYIGFTIIRVTAASESRSTRRPLADFWPKLPGTAGHVEDEWHEWANLRRHKLPDYVPDVAAGAPAPVQLTPWKISALRIEATIELRGYVTRADFAHLRIDHRRWLASGSGWLTNQDGRLVKGPGFPSFQTQHPKVYAEIKADYEKWAPKEGEAA